MYKSDNKVHKVENRIVSISQPWIRPIVRGKVKAPACRTLLMLIMSEPDTIPNGFLQIRYIGQETTGLSAKNMAFDYPVRSLGDQVRKQQKQISR